MSKNIRNFAPAFERNESCMQEKHCKTVPDLKSAKLQQEDGAIMLSLVVYAIGTHALGISSGVRYVP